MSEQRDQYRFCVDGRPAAPWRDDWTEAASDAVMAGYARWTRGTMIRWAPTAGGSIEHAASHIKEQQT